MNCLLLDTVTIRNASLPRKFQSAAEAGFTGLEIWGDDIGPEPQDLAHVLALKNRFGLAIESVCPPVSWLRWHHDWDPVLEAEIGRELPRYAFLGAEILIAPVTAELGTLADTARALDRLNGLAREHGMKIGLEPIGHVHKLARVGAAVDLLAAGDRDCVGLILDVFHFYRGCNALEELERIDPEKILAVHVDDAMDLPIDHLLGYRHRVYPGEGIFDVAGFCAAVARRGFKGRYIVELLNDSYWQADPDIVSRNAYRAALDSLRQAGIAIEGAADGVGR